MFYLIFSYKKETNATEKKTY